LLIGGQGSLHPPAPRYDMTIIFHRKDAKNTKFLRILLAFAVISIKNPLRTLRLCERLNYAFARDIFVPFAPSRLNI